MEYNFKNVVLIVLFNYSSCIKNKDFIKSLYEPYFKKIIFYSDYPVIADNEINFINIERGFFGYKFFTHFYENYRELLNNTDGLFYTMDDNIININILNLYSNKKIIIDPHNQQFTNIDKHSGWAWDKQFGKDSIYQLLENHEFKHYNYNKFTGSFSDYFYLPIEYINDKLYKLFKLFEQYNVFLEITIPSIIFNIESDPNKFNNYKSLILWDNDRNLLLDKKYFYDSFKKYFNLMVHPIKFNQNPDSINWLSEIFLKKKCIIITTINKPTECIYKFLTKKDYDIIIVGDNKTPNLYKHLDCVFLDIKSQYLLFNKLCSMIPINHYSRKNLGYLYAIKKNYNIIYETDDDNQPNDNFDDSLLLKETKLITEKSNNWINIYKYFTDNMLIWPRGYPLTLVKSDSNFSETNTDKKPSIICGLVDNDPDVDSIYRLILPNNNINWHADKHTLISNENICPFNTQNTFWLDENLFVSMLIPATVSFRYCDILRGIICNILLKASNNNLMIISPNVTQIRNEHNLIEDFKSEYEMFLINETILDHINTNISIEMKDLIKEIYQKLLNLNVIKELDLNILNNWLKYF